MTFSIITCTYNPNPIIFQRLIKAIAALKANRHFCYEWIIVDNNSNNKIKYTFNFSELLIPVLHVKEKKAGLTKARIAGTKAANGEWLIFLDDDNEPASNFLVELSKGIKENPQVNCWGPGNIDVEYIGKVKKWFLNNKSYFQARNEETKFGHEKHMQPYYPIGTGLCIIKEAMLDYVKKIESDMYNVSDRTGRSLVSGGDTQIILNNQVNGGIAGKLKKLSLTHMIEARKANFKYLRKQKFWTAASYHMVLQQVYSDFTIKQPTELNFYISDIYILAKRFYYEIKVKKRDFRSAYLNTCGFLGEYYAPYFALKHKPNQLFYTIQKLLNI